MPTPEQLIAFSSFFQQVGWPGILYLTFIYGGYRVWTWYTQVKWPQERTDRQEAEKSRAKREDDWYALIGRTVSNGEKVLMILALAYPEHASAVNKAIKE